MIIDRCRDKDEFYNFYKTHPMDDELYSYNFILNNPHLYCFYNEDNGILEGFIFITQSKNKDLYLSGAGIRKNMPENINAIIKVCEAYPKNMYSETDKKPAQVVLRKAGFKKISNNIFVRYKNGKI